MSRPSILFLTPVIPGVARNGLIIRAGLFLEGLARSHDVHVLVVPLYGGGAEPSELVRRLAAKFDVLTLEDGLDDRADLTARLTTAAGRRRATAVHPRPALCRAATLRTAAAVADAADSVDLVHVFRTFMLPYLDLVLDRPHGPKVIVDVDEVESITWRRLGDPEEGDRYEALENHYLLLVDQLVTSSSDEAHALGARFDHRRITVVPNAVRPPEPVESSAPAHDLLFVGNLSYRPNIDAVDWLCREVLEHLGDVTVAIVGSHPGAELLRLAADDRITVAADVPAVAPWYAGAKVAVVPLRMGGGTRTKVPEAFVHRRPVVSTRVGAEGLELGGPDSPILFADDPESFAAACRRLLDDPELAARLAAHGEQIVLRSGTVAVVAASIDRLMGHTLSGMTERANFVWAEGLDVTPVDGGAIVYHPERDRVHHLNRTAALILEFCSGQNGQADIVGMLQSAFDLPEPPDRQVEECLDLFVKEGLVR